MKEGPSGNPTAQNKLRNQERLRERQRLEDLGALLSTPQGRRFYWDVVERRSRCLSPSYAGESTHACAYTEGRRTVGLGLMAEAQKHYPKQYMQALTEALARSEADEAQRNEARVVPASPEEEDET